MSFKAGAVTYHQRHSQLPMAYSIFLELNWISIQFGDNKICIGAEIIVSLRRKSLKLSTQDTHWVNHCIIHREHPLKRKNKNKRGREIRPVWNLLKNTQITGNSSPIQQQRQQSNSVRRQSKWDVHHKILQWDQSSLWLAYKSWQNVCENRKHVISCHRKNLENH